MYAFHYQKIIKTLYNSMTKYDITVILSKIQSAKTLYKIYSLISVQLLVDFKNKCEIGAFVEMWMGLETVIQSEVSQKEKNKYRIITHICGTQKNGTGEPVCKADIETQIQRTNVWTPRGESGVGGVVVVVG